MDPGRVGHVPHAGYLANEIMRLLSGRRIDNDAVERCVTSVEFHLEIREILCQFAKRFTLKIIFNVMFRGNVVVPGESSETGDGQTNRKRLCEAMGMGHPVVISAQVTSGDGTPGR